MTLGMVERCVESFSFRFCPINWLQIGKVGFLRGGYVTDTSLNMTKAGKTFGEDDLAL